MKHNPKQIAIYIKAFRTISRQFDIIQTDLALLLFVSYRTLTRGYMSRQGFHNRLKHVMFRGYIVQCEGKGVRLKASDKGIDVLNQYYQLVDKLSEVKPTKQATKRLIDSI